MVIMLLPIGKLNMLIIIMTWEAVKKKGGGGGVTPPSLTICYLFKMLCVCLM